MSPRKRLRQRSRTRVGNSVRNQAKSVKRQVRNRRMPRGMKPRYSMTREEALELQRVLPGSRTVQFDRVSG